jgi:uracil-DNA glycosylase
MLVGQAPGDKEPIMQKPFAWTAGKTLFQWFQEICGINEEALRSSLYMTAVCRCFPGKKPQGGDRVPSAQEIQHCARWLRAEMVLLKPTLVVSVGNSQ